MIDLAVEFPLDEHIVHLNHAGVSPWPRRCAEAVQAFAEYNMRHSYAGAFGDWMATEQRLRERLARLIGAAGADDIALLKNTSDGLSQVAYGLQWQTGDGVVALAEEFVSNLLVWESLEQDGVRFQQVVPAADQSPEDALEAACDEHTRLLAVSSVQYGTGRRMDLVRLGRFCRRNDILFCVDAIQSLGALPFDVTATHADFVIAGAHKWLMSPFGIALFWVRPGVRDRLRPLSVGWHTLRDPMRFAGAMSDMETSARRFEAGTGNLAAVMGFEATLALFEEVGTETIAPGVLANADYLSQSLQALPGVELLSQTPAVTGNVCVTIAGHDLAALASQLESTYGVLCAARGPSLRFSPHFYTPVERMARAVDALGSLLRP